MNSVKNASATKHGVSKQSSKDLFSIVDDLFACIHVYRVKV